MSEVRPSYDNEIDLSEFFAIIWRGKWLISAFVGISVLSGFVYSQLVQPKFQVSASYAFNFYSVSAQGMCFNIRCNRVETGKHLKLFFDKDFNLQNQDSNLSFITEKSLSVKKYNEVFEKLNKDITNQIYNEALDEVNLIKTELNDAFISSKVAVTNILNAKRIIKAIDSGQNAISLGPVNMNKISPKVPLILVLSIILGGMIGVAFVLVNNTIRKRKESASKV